jgi:hypothetical protein
MLMLGQGELMVRPCGSGEWGAALIGFESTLSPRSSMMIYRYNVYDVRSEARIRP